jgi:hypothetical protein
MPTAAGVHTVASAFKFQGAARLEQGDRINLLPELPPGGCIVDYRITVDRLDDGESFLELRGAHQALVPFGALANISAGGVITPRNTAHLDEAGPVALQFVRVPHMQMLAGKRIAAIFTIAINGA